MDTAAKDCSSTRRLCAVLPHFIFVYAFIVLVTCCHTTSVILTLLLLVLLWVFSIPPIDHETAGRMLQRGKVSIIGHRGAGADVPENTISAVRLAKANGADGVEFDVAYTSDGVAVLMHDDTVDRTTDGQGDINSLTWDHVQTLNVAPNDTKKPGYDSEKVPTLEEVVQVCLNLGLKMYIDCKADARRTADVMSALYKKHPEMYEQALVCSFYPQVIYMVRLKDPNIVTGLIGRPWFMTSNLDGSWKAERALWARPGFLIVEMLLWWGHRAFLWYLCGNSTFSMLKDVCNRQAVRFYRSLGIDVLLWTVNDPVEKAFFTQGLGVDIITDTLLN